MRLLLLWSVRFSTFVAARYLFLGAVRCAGRWLFYTLAFQHGEEAGGQVTLLLLRIEVRLVLLAVVLGPRAAGVEVASGRRVRGRGHVSGNDHALPLALLLGVGDRDGRKE